MKKSKFTKAQIVFAIKQAESGVTVEEVCRNWESVSKHFIIGRRSTVV